MAINYPASLDSFSNPIGTDTLGSPDHAEQHSNANDAIEAIEAKVGVGAGTPTAGVVLVGSGNGTSDWSDTWNNANLGTPNITGGTIDLATINSSTLGTPSITGGTADAVTLGTPTITGGTSTSQTLAGTPVLDATSAVPFYNDNMYRQAIINGNFDVSQRATTFVAGANNDDVYTLDRWNLISDGNDVLDVSQEAVTDLPGSNYAIKLDVETAKRAGIVQFLEAKDAQKFKGKSVSISFAVKSANISAIRATVLSWSSTADSITSDVVGTWGATPTWATNWADNATPADLTVTSGWTTVKVENIAIDESTVNNLALAIWLPNEETIGDIVYISQVQMNMGSVALPFQPKSYEDELRACQRYFQLGGSGSVGRYYTTTAYEAVLTLPVTMRTAPSLSLTTTSPVIRRSGIGSDTGSSSAIASTFNITTTGVGFQIDGLGGSAGDIGMMADNYLKISAEL